MSDRRERPRRAEKPWLIERLRILLVAPRRRFAAAPQSGLAALLWAVAVAIGLAIGAFACDGPGLEPPFMPSSPSSGSSGSGAGASGGAAGTGGTGGPVRADGGFMNDPGVRDAGVSDAEGDGGADEDAGATR